MGWRGSLGHKGIGEFLSLPAGLSSEQAVERRFMATGGLKSSLKRWFIRERDRWLSSKVNGLIAYTIVAIS